MALRAPPNVQDAVEALGRTLEPEAWAEYDAGKGRCSIGAGNRCLSSMDAARSLLKRWPEIGDVVLPGRGVTASVQRLMRKMRDSQPAT